MIRSASWGREHGARVESPDQALQFAQLAAIHAHWTAKTEATTEEDSGPRVSAIAVESNALNLHLVCESPFFKKDRVIVKAEALALQSHDPLDEVVASIVPPLVDGPTVRPLDGAPKLAPALAAPQAPSEFSAGPVPVSSVAPSITAPGQSPTPSSWTGGSLAPLRRTLDQRRADSLDHSAMTPQAFVDAARRFGGHPPQRSAQTSTVRINEVQEDQGDRRPKSCTPARPDVTDV